MTEKSKTQRLTVRSGGHEWTVEAISAMDAAVLALKTYAFEELGLIITVTPEGKPDITKGGMEGWLVSTERALQAANINYKLNDGRPKMEPLTKTQ